MSTKIYAMLGGVSWRIVTFVIAGALVFCAGGGLLFFQAHKAWATTYSSADTEIDYSGSWIPRSSDNDDERDPYLCTTGNEQNGIAYNGNGTHTYYCWCDGLSEPVIGRDGAVTCYCTWGSGVVTQEATCVETGIMTYTCKWCGGKKYEKIAATGKHSYTWVQTKAATCTTTGEKAYVCSVCGTVETTCSIPKLDHDNTWQRTLEPTCTEDGEDSYICSVCGTVETTRSVAKLGHSSQWQRTLEPTCTEAGVESCICTICNEVTDTREVAATGHDYEESTSDDITVYVCKVCGYTYTSSVSHDSENTVSEDDATEKNDMTATDAVDGYPEASSASAIPVNNDSAKKSNKKKSSRKRTGKVCIGSFTYRISSAGTAVCVKATSKKYTAWRIPACIRTKGSTYRLIAISPRLFLGNKSLRKVSGGANLKRIGERAFSGCTALRRYECKSKHLKSIGRYAFRNCKKLGIVTLSTTKLSKLGKHSFKNCKSLRSFTCKSHLKANTLKRAHIL